MKLGENYLSKFTRRAAAIASALAPWRPIFQIWNEPDHPVHPGYAPTLNTDVFAQMLLRTSNAIRAVDPGLKIIGGGLSSGNAIWLETVISHLNHQIPVDAFAVHPYGQRPEPNWPSPDWGFGYLGDLVWNYRQRIGQAIPLWITEAGEKYEVNTYPDRQEGQAEYLRRFYKTATSHLGDMVEQVAWFCYADGMVPPFGLVEADGVSKKPAYYAYQKLQDLTRSRYGVTYISHNTPQTMVAGQTNTVQITLRNTSNRVWLDGGANQIRLGYRWYTGDGREVEPRQWQDLRTSLPATLSPDQEITLNAKLNAPLVDGVYTLRWDLIEELVTWFGWQGAPTLDQRIMVNPDDFIVGGVNPLHPMRVEASHNNIQSGTDNLQNVIDGNTVTRWSSRTPQTAGMWLQIDLGSLRNLRQLRLDNANSPDDYPRGYKVEFSLDGQSWQTLLQKDDNNGPLNIAFPTQRLRYIRITLSKSDPLRWWSVHEIEVSDSIKFSPSASHNNVLTGGDNLSNALDLTPETRWSSNQLQSQGMWFQLDLQNIRTVRGVVLEHGTSVGDYPRGYIITLSQKRHALGRGGP